MRYLLLILVSAISFSADAQTPMTMGDGTNNLMFSMTGRPVFNKKDVIEEGEHSIPSSNCYARVFPTTGKPFVNVLGRMELTYGQFVFVDKEDRELVPEMPIRRIEFDSCDGKNRIVFQSGYLPVDKQSLTSFYEVLFEGKVQLLKLHELSWIDQKPYSVNNVTRTYRIKPAYYISVGNQPVKLSKNRTEILTLLPANAEAAEYVKKNRPDLKKDNELIALLELYK